MYKHIVTLLLSSSLIACAATPESESIARQPIDRSSSDCISEGTIRDYNVLDDANLIVTASVRRHYHVTLSRPAFGLRSTWQIGFTSTTGRICAGFAEVVVDDSLYTDAIRIQSIRRLTPEEVDDLLIRYGKKEPEIEIDPVPEPVDSAEVEELTESRSDLVTQSAISVRTHPASGNVGRVFNANKERGDIERHA